MSEYFATIFTILGQEPPITISLPGRFIRMELSTSMSTLSFLELFTSDTPAILTLEGTTATIRVVEVSTTSGNTFENTVTLSNTEPVRTPTRNHQQRNYSPPSTPRAPLRNSWRTDNSPGEDIRDYETTWSPTFETRNNWNPSTPCFSCSSTVAPSEPNCLSDSD